MRPLLLGLTLGLLTGIALTTLVLAGGALAELGMYGPSGELHPYVTPWMEQHFQWQQDRMTPNLLQQFLSEQNRGLRPPC